MKGRKIFSQEYANDVTVVAEDEGGMIRVMEKYVERKGLEVNVEKTKVIMRRREGERLKKVVWK